MPSLLIRNVDPALHARLKSQAVTGADIVRLAKQLFGEVNGPDLELLPRNWRDRQTAPDFGDEPDPR